MAKLDVKACGVAMGIVAAAAVLILGTINLLFFWAEGWRRMMTVMYFGYRPTLGGAIFGSVWAFIYAFVIGISFALLYNRVTEENKAESDERIKKLAHRIWEKKGRPAGTSADDWKEAERLVKGG